MGKVVAIVLIALIAFGVYWFYWEDGGANAPVTVEYEISGKAVQINPQTRKLMQFELDGHINVYATPNKARLDFSFDGKQGNSGSISIAFGAIVRLDKKKLYVMYPEEEIYTEISLKFVKVEKDGDDDDDEIDWDEVLKATVNGDWFGEEGERYFAREYTPPKPRPGVSFGVWFTDQTRLGRRYTKGINKFLRLEPDLDEDDDSFAETIDMLSGKTGKAEERPQIEHPDYPFFPLPLKVEVNARNPRTRGTTQFTIEAKTFTRGKIKKSKFLPDKDYEKLDEEDFTNKVQADVMAKILKLNIKFPGPF